MDMNIITPLIIGLISGIIGYLLGKMASVTKIDHSSIQDELDSCNSSSIELKAKIGTLERDLKNAKTTNMNAAQSFASESKETSLWNPQAALDAMGKKIKQDDLKIVEGIGPKIADLFHAAGIKTWKTLSETAVKKSQKILDDAGNRYAVHNPSTWAKQAKLAYEGKWKELKKLQDSLDGGKK